MTPWPSGRARFSRRFQRSERERWLNLPFTGCDGLPKTGQSWLRSGLLAATISRLRWRGKPLNCWLAPTSMAKYRRSACSLRRPRSRGLRHFIPRSADQIAAEGVEPRYREVRVDNSMPNVAGHELEIGSSGNHNGAKVEATKPSR